MHDTVNKKISLEMCECLQVSSMHKVIDNTTLDRDNIYISSFTGICTLNTLTCLDSSCIRHGSFTLDKSAKINIKFVKITLSISLYNCKFYFT